MEENYHRFYFYSNDLFIRCRYKIIKWLRYIIIKWHLGADEQAVLHSKISKQPNTIEL